MGVGGLVERAAADTDSLTIPACNGPVKSEHLTAKKKPQRDSDLNTL